MAATRDDTVQLLIVHSALIQQQAATGAKLLLAVSARIAQRYRETQKKLVLFARLAATMQQELDRQT